MVAINTLYTLPSFSCCFNCALVLNVVTRAGDQAFRHRQCLLWRLGRVFFERQPA